MTHLTKLTFKTVAKAGKQKDPVQNRRTKLAQALGEQKHVLQAMTKNEDYFVEREKWMANDQGERVLVKTRRSIRPWFFEKDGGWYVQCKYGARMLLLDGTNNSAFVKKLADVQAVLDAFIAAANAGEFDAAIARSVERKTPIAA